MPKNKRPPSRKKQKQARWKKHNLPSCNHTNVSVIPSSSSLFTPGNSVLDGSTTTAVIPSEHNRKKTNKESQQRNHTEKYHLARSRLTDAMIKPPSENDHLKKNSLRKTETYYKLVNMTPLKPGDAEFFLNIIIEEKNTRRGVDSVRVDRYLEEIIQQAFPEAKKNSAINIESNTVLYHLTIIIQRYIDRNKKHSDTATLCMAMIILSSQDDPINHLKIVTYFLDFIQKNDVDLTWLTSASDETHYQFIKALDLALYDMPIKDVSNDLSIASYFSVDTNSGHYKTSRCSAAHCNNPNNLNELIDCALPAMWSRTLPAIEKIEIFGDILLVIYIKHPGAIIQRLSEHYDPLFENTIKLLKELNTLLPLTQEELEEQDEPRQYAEAIQRILLVIEHAIKEIIQFNKTSSQKNTAYILKKSLIINLDNLAKLIHFNIDYFLDNIPISHISYQTSGEYIGSTDPFTEIQITLVRLEKELIPLVEEDKQKRQHIRKTLIQEEITKNINPAKEILIKKYRSKLILTHKTSIVDDQEENNEEDNNEKTRDEYDLKASLKFIRIHCKFTRGKDKLELPDKLCSLISNVKLSESTKILLTALGQYSSICFKFSLIDRNEINRCIALKDLLLISIEGMQPYSRWMPEDEQGKIWHTIIKDVVFLNQTKQVVAYLEDLIPQLQHTTQALLSHPEGVRKALAIHNKAIQSLVSNQEFSASEVSSKDLEHIVKQLTDTLQKAQEYVQIVYSTMQAISGWLQCREQHWIEYKKYMRGAGRPVNCQSRQSVEQYQKSKQQEEANIALLEDLAQRLNTLQGAATDTEIISTRSLTNLPPEQKFRERNPSLLHQVATEKATRPPLAQSSTSLPAMTKLPLWQPPPFPQKPEAVELYNEHYPPLSSIARQKNPITTNTLTVAQQTLKQPLPTVNPPVIASDSSQPPLSSHPEKKNDNPEQEENLTTVEPVTPAAAEQAFTQPLPRVKAPVTLSDSPQIAIPSCLEKIAVNSEEEESLTTVELVTPAASEQASIQPLWTVNSPQNLFYPPPAPLTVEHQQQTQLMYFLPPEPMQLFLFSPPPQTPPQIPDNQTFLQPPMFFSPHPPIDGMVRAYNNVPPPINNVVRNSYGELK